MNKRHILFAILSGVLISLSWYNFPTALINLVAFVPLLIVEYEAMIKPNSTKRVIWAGFTTFLIWNVAVTFWIAWSTVGGAIMAIVANAMSMTLFFSLFHVARQKIVFLRSQYSLIIWWLTFEFIFYHTEIAYSWLHLGYSFARLAPLVQWYEITGVLGGSLLILFVNITLTQIYIAYKEQKVTKQTRTLIIAVILVPVALFTCSIIRYKTYRDQGDIVEIAIVQPNIDPWSEKFDRLSNKQQLELILKLAETVITPRTQLLVAPETAITEHIWEERLSQQQSTGIIKRFIADRLNLAVIIGATTHRIYNIDETPSHTARKFIDADSYYDRYNTALLYDSTDSIQIYHKSRLVVGVEMMPYPKYMKFLEKISINLGGTVGSLGVQKEPSVFLHRNITAAPVICYESVFGEYVSQYVKKGANLLTIITNDGWWGNTPGYRQHLHYARLRAIENRRSVARSANTGISCFINQRGDVQQPVKWWTPGIIKGEVKLNKATTFYTIHGDYLGRITGCIALAIFIYLVAIRVVKLVNQLKNILNSRT